MHELAVCQGMLRQVESVAREHGAHSVDVIHVQIGPLSGVVPELLQHAFPLASAGTVAEHARLELECLPVRVRCRSCDAETEALPNRLVCGQCGDWKTDVISGDELLLSSVELLRGSEPEPSADHSATH